MEKIITVSEPDCRAKPPMEDFVHWLGLRAYNSSAARNDKEQA